MNAMDLAKQQTSKKIERVEAVVRRLKMAHKTKPITKFIQIAASWAGDQFGTEISALDAGGDVWVYDKGSKAWAMLPAERLSTSCVQRAHIPCSTGPR